ncbi:MAG: Surfeit locus 1 family protein [Phenylobacterium zucineum]|nr:MAG: Surfeit locus 1 family protein [Phenylobacterium zucineum]
MVTESLPARFRLPLGLTLATVISLTILIGLGTWQLKRLAWKEDLLARVAALQAARPQPLDEILDLGIKADFTRVEADCPGLAKAKYLELFSVRDTGAGVRIISACRITTRSADSILVDRGFVSDKTAARPSVDPADTSPFHLVGVLRRPDHASFVTPPNEIAANHWYSRNVADMAQALGVSRPAPMFLMAETSTNPEWKALNPAPLPSEISNRHLEYALTWFGLAAALAGVYVAVLLKKARG